jgi:archaellum component FlaC
MAAGLDTAAGVIAVAGLAWSSSKALYDLVSSLSDVPDSIANLKDGLSQTQNALETLQETIKSNQMEAIEELLKKVKIEEALKATQALCDDFSNTIKKYTSHSTDTKFSKRDRLTVNFHESKITQFSDRLRDCRQTLTLLVISINL